VSELLKSKNVNPNICDSQKRTAVWWAAKMKMTSAFLSLMCTPHWVIDITTKPEGENYSHQYANYLDEYARDRFKFQEKYGGTQSYYEHPNPGKLTSLFLFLILTS